MWYTNTQFACMHLHVGGLLFKHQTAYAKVSLFTKCIFPFFEYICIIDVFIYFHNGAPVVKGGIYVLPWHTQ